MAGITGGVEGIATGMTVAMIVAMTGVIAVTTGVGTVTSGPVTGTVVDREFQPSHTALIVAPFFMQACARRRAFDFVARLS